MTRAIRPLASRLKSGVNCFGVFGGERYFDVLLAQLFLDEGDRVITGRQALDFELAIGSGDREERTFGYVDEHAHPGMLVALDGEHDFFASECLFEWRGRGRLGLVPLAVVVRSGMSVVRGWMAVADVVCLSSRSAETVRRRCAAASIE